MTLHDTMLQPLIENYQLEGTSEQVTGAYQNFFSVVIGKNVFDFLETADKIFACIVY